MKNYTLTIELDSYKLQYITKFLDLLYAPQACVNGEQVLSNIKEQLDTLKVEEIYSDYQTTFVGSGTTYNDET